MSVVEPIFIAAASDAGIRNAAALAHAAGGGTVIIPVGEITLTSPLPLYPGVIYCGTGWAPNFNTVGSGDLSFTNGTILKGDATFPAIAGNNFDSPSAPTNFDLFINGDGTSSNPGMIRGCGARNLTFYDFTDGVRVGGKHTPGCQYGFFENLNFIYCGIWSFYLENGTENVVNTLIVNYPRNRITGIPATGKIYIGASGGSVMHTGNLDIANIYTYRDSYLTRGLVFEARGSISTRNNLVEIGKTYICGNPQNEVVSAVGGVSGTGITVTDGTLFQVGMPVVTTNSSINFTANTSNNPKIYIVASISGNVLTLSNELDAPALDATGLIGNIKTFGWPKVELIGRTEGTAVSYVNSLRFTCLDLGESTASVDVFMHNAWYNNFDICHTSPPYSTYTPGSITSYGTFALRVSNENRIVSPETFTLDLGLGSQRNIVTGQTNTVFGTTMGIGLRQVGTSGTRAALFSGALYLGGVGGPDIYTNAATGTPNFRQALVFDQVEYDGRDSGQVPDSRWAGTYINAPAADEYSGLPALNDNLVGLEFTVVNNGSKNWIFSAGGFTDVTAFVPRSPWSDPGYQLPVAALSSVTFRACKSGGSYFWRWTS